VKLTLIRPTPDQESVWDYPRPPRLELVQKRIQIISAGAVLADTTRAYRVLETSHPPSYYLPPEDIQMERLTLGTGSSFCEWKGAARYYALGGHDVAWYYPSPAQSFAPIAGYLAFYAGRVVSQVGDGCFVAGERVTPQAGGFYGGWITASVVGPFKGIPGSVGW
jgi:uncharacterized protein (DUF427 family)